MQNDYRQQGVVILGVTAASGVEAQQFILEEGVNYPVLADAGAVKEAWGVKRLWGSVVYLVDRDGQVVTRGIDEAMAVLDARRPG